MNGGISAGGLAGPFGRALLVRHWGRIGTPGQVRLDPHPDQGAAINALAGIFASNAGEAMDRDSAIRGRITKAERTFGGTDTY